MKVGLKNGSGNGNGARNAWLLLGGLLTLGLIIMTVRELPSVRRELKLMNM